MIALHELGRRKRRPRDGAGGRPASWWGLSDGSSDFSPFRHGGSVAATPLQPDRRGADGSLARNDPRHGRPLPARAALYARPRSEIPRQARPAAELSRAHDLVRKPVATFRDHALTPYLFNRPALNCAARTFPGA